MNNFHRAFGAILCMGMGMGNIHAAGSGYSNTDFNPQISLILDGQYTSYEQDPEDYRIPGFQLGGEAGLPKEGFGLGHSELTLSANIDHYFYAQSTLAIAEHDGETELELEEAFIQTLGLGRGFTVKFGRFLSSFGYRNVHHRHAWDFADASLPYNALLGGYLADDGVQVSYIADTDLLVEFNAELLAGNAFPAGSFETGGINAHVVSMTLGGDLALHHYWQLGLSHYRADDILERSGDAHAHDAGVIETPAFSGDTRIDAVDLVYKWAIDGNARQRHIKIAVEYMNRHEDGIITLLDSGPPLETSSYRGDQSGWYASFIYRFAPRWRSGLRLDRLHSDNTGSVTAVLNEASLTNPVDDPQRQSLMLEWTPSEYSRLRLQYNHDETRADTDNQWWLQYTVSLGAHGAHQF